MTRQPKPGDRRILAQWGVVPEGASEPTYDTSTKVFNTIETATAYSLKRSGLGQGEAIVQEWSQVAPNQDPWLCDWDTVELWIDGDKVRTYTAGYEDWD